MIAVKPEPSDDRLATRRVRECADALNSKAISATSRSHSGSRPIIQRRITPRAGTSRRPTSFRSSAITRRPRRALDLMRWGLVPYWAKDIKVGFSTINAMAETVDTKPVFREAFKRRRCLVLVEAHYEWKKLDAKTKQPYPFALASDSVMALAGLWETWKSPAEESVRSFTIVTTTPNDLCAEIYNRMPVILPPSVWPAWLGEESVDSDAVLKSLLAPYPADEMAMWPVSPRVGNVKNNDPSLIEPMELA